MKAEITTLSDWDQTRFDITKYILILIALTSIIAGAVRVYSHTNQIFYWFPIIFTCLFSIILYSLLQKFKKLFFISWVLNIYLYIYLVSRVLITGGVFSTVSLFFFIHSAYVYAVNGKLWGSLSFLYYSLALISISFTDYSSFIELEKPIIGTILGTNVFFASIVLVLILRNGDKYKEKIRNLEKTKAANVFIKDISSDIKPHVESALKNLKIGKEFNDKFYLEKALNEIKNVDDVVKSATFKDIS